MFASARVRALFGVAACTLFAPATASSARAQAPLLVDGGVAQAHVADAAATVDASSTAAPLSARSFDASTPATLAADASGPTEITVVGSSKAQRMRESADAVSVVELDVPKRQAADLGEVLARTEGISVRRAGGLGSEARFSLNGLSDDQIRFLLDDVPLEFAGFRQGFANMPWLMLERVVIYRGVVPIRFGADALGGAVNLLTFQPTRGSGGEASYQIGSFGTHRATLSGYQVHRPSGLFTRLSLYLDSARNDYEVDGDIVDAQGQFTTRRVKRKNDAYLAYGGSAEVGFVKRPWAERLVLRAFTTRIDRGLQTNLIQTRPYGEAGYEQASYGATLRYDQPLSHALKLEAFAGYSYQPTYFDDDAAFTYDWYGRRVAPSKPGETTANPIVRRYWQHNTFARVLATLRLAEGNKLELALLPTYVERSGKDETVREGRDPLRDKQQLLSIVSGLAYRLNAFEDVLENVLFAKSYVYRTWADQTAPNGTRIARDAKVTRFGVGDALRIRLAQPLYAKLSYELATRLPTPVEIFGDGILVNPNLSLRAESSHNGNLELTLRHDSPRVGELRASANGFIRKIHQQILLVGTERDARHENVYGARSVGVEANAGFTSLGRYLTLDANVTYVDLRNVSSRGTFGRYDGDRIPNRPYIVANGAARGMLSSLLRGGDELSLTWFMRYVHEFTRFWERDGDAETKYRIAQQRSHTLSLMYSLALERVGLDGVFEVQNLTDARLYDNFGAERPGRAYMFKLSGRR